MALRFLEYKYDRIANGGKIVPLWVDEGGVFYNSANHSYVGVCADDEVKVPDSVTKFANKEALQDRNKAIHAVTPWTKLKEEGNPSAGFENKTDAEVEAESDAWWDRIVTEYS